MSWTKVGDFNSLIGSGVRTRTLAVYGNELYVGTLDHPTHKGQVWKTPSSAHTWSFVRQFENDVIHLYIFGGLLFAMVRSDTVSGVANGFWSFNGSTWTLEKDLSSLADTGTIGNFVEFSGDLYAIHANAVFRRNGGLWTTIDGTPGSGIGDETPGKYAIGVYNGNLYLSAHTGSISTGDFFVKIVSGATVFTESNSGLPISDRHYQARTIIEYDNNAFFAEPRYVHEYDGSTTTVSKTFTYDSKSDVGACDAYIFNGKLWAGHIYDSGLGLIGGAYKYDGATWVTDSGLNYYSDTNSAGQYAPPIGFFKWNQGSGNTYHLYACAGPGEVWINTTETETVVSSNVKVQGIAASKAADNLLYAGIWKAGSTTQYVRTFNGATLTGIRETSLGTASSTEITNGTRAAYPFAVDGVAGGCLVYGNFIYSSSTRHIIVTTDGGVSWSVVEDGWGNDVCGALVIRNSQIYAIRNKASVGLLYVGTTSGSFVYVSTLDFPVGPFGLELSITGQYLLAINKVTNNVPRVMITPYPFKIWKDITYNFPVAGSGTSVVSLRD